MEENMNRQTAIHEKGFAVSQPKSSAEYAKLKIGTRKIINDVVIGPEYYENWRKDPRILMDKQFIIQALMNNDLPVLREISRFFYRTNGIYQKVVNYFAFMYRYDWYAVPEVFSEAVGEKKLVAEFAKVLDYLDNSHIKKMCGDIALKVIRDGVFWGYVVEGEDGMYIQELPWKWCRSRYTIKGLPAVEFNMKFFDATFLDVSYRMKVLDLFPKEFKQGYMLYKQGKLPCDCITENHEHGSWYLLDSTYAFKFVIAGTGDAPLFVNAIPELIDLKTTQGIDRQRQLQKLLKIIVQQLPLDKNGDLIFDVDEARDIHNNAVEMLADAIGVDVLTTFADIKGIEVSDANATVTDDSLDNAERTVYNALGVSKNLFNTDGNLALEKSILTDEGSMRDLLLQFEYLYDQCAQRRSTSKKKYNFRLYMLQTTQYNYQAISKLYKEHTQIGFSKMLPQIALGQSQSFILNTAHFENEILNLAEVMIPPLMSSTMSGEDLQAIKDTRNAGNGTTGGNQSAATSNEGGRPAKDESELSEKTIQNKESMS